MAFAVGEARCARQVVRQETADSIQKHSKLQGAEVVYDISKLMLSVLPKFKVKMVPGAGEVLLPNCLCQVTSHNVVESSTTSISKLRYVAFALTFLCFLNHKALKRRREETGSKLRAYKKGTLAKLIKQQQLQSLQNQLRSGVQAIFELSASGNIDKVLPSASCHGKAHVGPDPQGLITSACPT